MSNIYQRVPVSFDKATYLRVKEYAKTNKVSVSAALVFMVKQFFTEEVR